jgi:hypothetical protein
MKTRGTLPVACALGLMALAWGCDVGGGAGKAGSSGAQTDAIVKGKVTVKGKAVSKGTIVFEAFGRDGSPMEGKAFDVRKDGTYEARTLTGRNGINISSTGNPVADSSYNRTYIEVAPGENVRDFDLPFQP